MSSAQKTVTTSADRKARTIGALESKVATLVTKIAANKAEIDRHLVAEATLGRAIASGAYAGVA